MANEHLNVIQSGVRYNRELKTLSNSAVGNRDHPRGAVLNAFNKAKTALAGNFDNPLAMAIILEEYRATVLAAVRDASEKALGIGDEHANLMLETWDLPTLDESEAALIDQGVRATDTILLSQIRAMESGTLTEAQVLGSNRRVGLFAAGIVMGAVNNWLITSAASTVASKIAQGMTRGGVSPKSYQRQAVAAIDENTTLCCLAVHGQLVGMKEEFFTSEPPAWATYQERPPFHRFCRTSQVLVRTSAALDKLTDDMELAAYLEGQARKQPGYVAPHPATAFTRVRNPRGVPFTKVVKTPIAEPTASITVEAGKFTDLSVAKEEMSKKWGVNFIDDYDDLPDYWTTRADEYGQLFSTTKQQLNVVNTVDIELTRLAAQYPGFKPELDDFSLLADGRGAAHLNRRWDFLEGRSIMTTKFKDYPASTWDYIEDYAAQGLKVPNTTGRRGSLIADNFRHELGHVNDTFDFSEYWFYNVTHEVKLRPGSTQLWPVERFSKQWFRDNISDYSGGDEVEQIAESFGIYTRADYVAGTLPPEIERAMEIMTNQRDLPKQTVPGIND